MPFPLLDPVTSTKDVGDLTQSLRKGSVIQYSAFRLLVIPFIIYTVWILETFLLEGSLRLFAYYRPLPFILYTVFANIIVGIAVPVVTLQSAFTSGAVNMFQTGFRSAKKTALMTVCTGLIGYLILVTFSPYGMNRFALFGMLILQIPVAIASVLVCWVLIGTHVQVYVRHCGAVVSIITGVLITGVLFGLTAIAHSPPVNQPDIILLMVLTGMVSALFFFSVRDVYSSVLFVAFGLAFVFLQNVDTLYTVQITPLILGLSLLSFLCLVGCHVYLFRNFVTTRLPGKIT